MTDKRIVLTAIGSKSEAEDLAWELVERKLAACVNILDMQVSIYRWKGEIKSEKECLMVIKTTTALSEHLVAAIRELHPYDVPEYIEIPIEGGSRKYLDWIAESVKIPE